jgi:hypothetical protein
MMPAISPTLIALGVALAVGAGAAWKLTADAKDDHYTAIVETQRAHAEEALRLAQTKAIDIERKHNALATELELSHAERSKEKEKMLADNRRLARELGGLRDPGKRTTCRATVPANAAATGTAADDPADGRFSTEAEGLLSPEASEFLLDFARECDRAADYAKTAHDWAVGLGDD